MEAWEQVFVGDEGFLADVHGALGCAACHGGDAAATEMEAAHDGIVVDPDPVETCASCHGDITEDHAGGLHSTLEGYLTVLGERSSEETFPVLMEAFDNHCASCHASCGQCHVSRPTSAGGGLLDGHAFKPTPPMNFTCTGCHGSRIEMEFKGKNTLETGAAIPGDVHFNPNGMPCFDCHSGDQMHGALEPNAVHRYEGPETPACADCHLDLAGSGQHTEAHLERLACQVCHSVEYKN